jgi:putative membrane protein
MTDPRPPRKPVVIARDAPAEHTPASAPPPPDAAPALGRAIALAARPPSRLARLFCGALGGFVALMAGLAAADWIAALLSRSPLLGGIAFVFFALTLFFGALLALGELAALARLSRMDALRRAAEAAYAAGDLAEAHRVAEKLSRHLSGRAELAEPLARLARRKGALLDADALLGLAEAELLAPLDREAEREIEKAARLVAGATALVPLALADVAAALIANLRMIRRISEIYGGRAGTLGALRLARAVAAHLLATGALAVGDDLIGSVAGGGILAKISRRFGEGVVNGALTARLGIAAMDVTRPLPFRAAPRPRVTAVIQRALTGLFAKET